ncbi:Split-Soret cytochrome c [Natranaerofaba carboxydovora]|nr:Split-Soret cytochrome c [Natranaerofaba carboxydovora]
MFWPFRGGLSGWGSICGAIPPAAAFLAAIAEPDDHMDLTQELMAWYQQFPFPETQLGDTGELPQTPVNSSLCHVSITKWMVYANKEHGMDIESRGDDRRGDRCAGLTADVAAYTIEMMNKFIDGEFEVVHTPAEVRDDCMACHDDTGGNHDYAAHGQEDCTECHTDKWEDYTEDHP